MSNNRKLFIDESGNTGATLCRDSKFNFSDQPYYVLAGLFLDEKQENCLITYMTTQKIKYKIQGNELKAKNLYDTKPIFITELVEYIINNRIPFFIELMDKQFYLNILLTEYFIVPYYLFPINEQNILAKKTIASGLTNYLNIDIYEKFTTTVNEYTNESLENFYEILINHFNSIGNTELRDMVLMTKEAYIEQKENDKNEALKKFLPIPDKKPNNRLVHCLPNYGALTNIIGRTNLFQQKYHRDDTFEIIHDEQKQFDNIFQDALESMKNIDTDTLVKNIDKKGIFNVENSLKLSFIDSKTSIPIQVADLMAGLVMKFWRDFITDNQDRISTYLPLIVKLTYQCSSIGINYVLPKQQHEKLMLQIRSLQFDFEL